MIKTNLEFHPALKPYVRYCNIKKLARTRGEVIRNSTQADPWPSIVVNMGPTARKVHQGRRVVLPRALAFGAGEMPDEYELEPGHQHLTFSFYPGKAHPFFGTSMRAFTDNPIPLCDCWGREGRILEHRIAEAASLSEVKAFIEAELLRRLAHFKGSPAALAASVKLALDSRGTVTVGRMAEAGGCSLQHLKRLFCQWVGLTPKVFGRILRFQAACSSLSPAQEPDWAALSCEFGYSHQSHLIRDFESFAGMSPAVFFDSVILASSCPNSIWKAFQPEAFPYCLSA